MEVLKSVFSVAKSIYNLHDQAGHNKKQCYRLKKRIELLMVPIENINPQSDVSENLDNILRELLVTLNNAESWLKKYSSRMWWLKFLKAKSIKEEFDLINDRLRDAADSVVFLMSVEHRQAFLKYYDENTYRSQNRKAIEEDMKELVNSLKGDMESVTDKVDTMTGKLEHLELGVQDFLRQIKAQNMESVADKVDHIAGTVESVTDKVSNMAGKVNHLESGVQDIVLWIKTHMFSGIRTPWDPIVIQATDLRKRELVMEKPNYNLYKGEYHKSPVAIKVLKGPLNRNDDFVRKTFNSECQTMKKFECLNILRLYGICIDTSNSEPCYSMVMEYCEKGTLRELLNREQDLTLEQRVLMALDAARALYRLHQTELKPILHGNLSSSKFLVDRTYCLKLSGFELSKTESSMRRSSNVATRIVNSEWKYIAPETLKNINAYDKHSEIYSLGIVLYEIATGKVPLKGLFDVNLKDLHEKLGEEMNASLPAVCPAVLRDIVTKSQERNPKDRPSAGAIVDLLIDYLNKPEATQ
ncbi:mixed lineage kinase domain-like protein isoform 2-T3 [Rhinophrynus dorsalis]